MNSRIPYNHHFDEFVVRVMDEVGRVFAHPLNKRFNLHTSRLPAHRVMEADNNLRLSLWTEDVFFSFQRTTVKEDQNHAHPTATSEQFTALIRENFAHCPHAELKECGLTSDHVRLIAGYLGANFDRVEDPLTGEQIFRLKKLVTAGYVNVSQMAQTGDNQMV